eukprot:Ihof_evm2s26 gene=Ihof_evmTU2s26
MSLDSLALITNWLRQQSLLSSETVIDNFDDLHSYLREGDILCQLFNKYQPGSIVAEKGGGVAAHRYQKCCNLRKFIQACSILFYIEMPLPDPEIYHDGGDQENMTQLLVGLGQHVGAMPQESRATRMIQSATTSKVAANAAHLYPNSSQPINSVSPKLRRTYQRTRTPPDDTSQLAQGRPQPQGALPIGAVARAPAMEKREVKSSQEFDFAGPITGNQPALSSKSSPTFSNKSSPMCSSSSDFISANSRLATIDSADSTSSEPYYTEILSADVSISCKCKEAIKSPEGLTSPKASNVLPSTPLPTPAPAPVPLPYSSHTYKGGKPIVPIRRKHLPHHSAANQVGTQTSQPSYPIPVEREDKLIKRHRKKAVALFAYAATKTDELSFERGQTIELLSTPNEGWWQGRGPEGCGWFPSPYVQEYEGDIVPKIDDDEEDTIDDIQPMSTNVFLDIDKKGTTEVLPQAQGVDVNGSSRHRRLPHDLQEDIRTTSKWKLRSAMRMLFSTNAKEKQTAPVEIIDRPPIEVTDYSTYNMFAISNKINARRKISLPSTLPSNAMHMLPATQAIDINNLAEIITRQQNTIEKLTNDVGVLKAW